MFRVDWSCDGCLGHPPRGGGRATRKEGSWIFGTLPRSRPIHVKTQSLNLKHDKEEHNKGGQCVAQCDDPGILKDNNLRFQHRNNNGLIFSTDWKFRQWLRDQMKVAEPLDDIWVELSLYAVERGVNL
jgi:hypothetical protein